MVVVARLLKPEDFGLVAMVTVITAILDLFASAGLSAATVQKSTINNEQISTLFWINICFGVMLGILCVLIAPAIVAFYHEPRLFWGLSSSARAFFLARPVCNISRYCNGDCVTRLSCDRIFVPADKPKHWCCCSRCRLWLLGLGGGRVSLPAMMTFSVWVAAAWIPGRPRRDVGIGSLLHFGGTSRSTVSYPT